MGTGWLIARSLSFQHIYSRKEKDAARTSPQEGEIKPLLLRLRKFDLSVNSTAVSILAAAPDRMAATNTALRIAFAHLDLGRSTRLFLQYQVILTLD